MTELELAHTQLQRMRGMTRYYHERFFTDTRYTAFGVIALLLIGFWDIPEAFLLVPLVALIGANQTAFDASYLFMARRYAAALEAEINSAMRRKILVGADLEDRYLVPLQGRRFVGVAFGAGFSWFGWMTVFYTLLGVSVSAWALLLAFDEVELSIAFGYLTVLAILAFGSLIVGWWWFVSGTGQRRLDEVIETQFGRSASV